MLGLRCYAGFSLVVVRGDYSSVAVTPSGFSLQQGVRASVMLHMGLERRLSSYGAPA